MPTGLSNTDLANGALIALGDPTIGNLSDTTSLARLVNSRFQAVRDAVLRSHNWNSATRRSTLGTISGTPINEYATAFALPEQFLKVIEVLEGDFTAVRYSMEQHDDGSGFVPALLSDAGSINLRYVARIDADAMDPLLYNAISDALAVDLSYKRSKSENTRAALMQRARQSLADARFADAGDNPNQELFFDPWEQARNVDSVEPFWDATFRNTWPH